MSKKHQIVVFSLAACVVSVPAWPAWTDITVAQTLPNSEPWVSPYNPDGATYLFSWGDSPPDLSTVPPPATSRVLSYEGPKVTKLDYFTISTTIQNTYGASNLDTNYLPGNDTNNLIQATDLYVRLVLSSDTSKYLDAQLFPTVADPSITTSQQLLSARIDVGALNANRIVDPNTNFIFGFYSNAVSSLTPLPDAVYSGTTVQFAIQTALQQLTLTPSANPSDPPPTLDFGARRAGTTGTTTRQAVAQNTGDTGSTLKGTFAAPTGAQFGGTATTDWTLTRPDDPFATNPTQTQNYTFAAKSSLVDDASNPVNRAVVSTGSAAVTTDGRNDVVSNPPNPTVALTGTTVGPVFGLSGTDVGANAIDFGKVLITKSGSQGPNTKDLRVTNGFDAQGVNYGNALTGLTAATSAISGTDAGAFSGSLGSSVLPDNYDTVNAPNYKDFQMAFSPTSGTAAGKSYSAHVDVNTDVNAAGGLGGDGADYGYDLTGTAYLATLSTSTPTLDYGNLRIGTAAVTRTLSVTNQTEGGFALTNVTYGDASGVTPTPGTEVARVGASTTASLASLASDSRDYTMRATSALGSPTTAQALSAQVSVTSTEADLPAPVQLTGTAVGPVYNFSGDGVGGNIIDFGKVLITKSGPQGPNTNNLKVTNAFNAQGVDYGTALTGLTAATSAITGTGASAFGGGLSSSVITDNFGATNFKDFQMTFAPTSATAAGTTYSAQVDVNTDVNAASGLGGDGADFTYNLTGTAYQATLTTSTPTLDYGLMRVGGSAVTRNLQVTNATGGGFALTDVTYADATNVTPTPGTAVARVGAGTTSALASGTSDNRDYTMRAVGTMGAPVAPQAMTAQVNVTSNQADLASAVQLSGTAVGPVFNFSGNDVAFDYTDNGTCQATVCSGGTVNLGALTAGSVTKTLTLNNLFDPGTLNVGDLADLTLLNIGFWNGSAYVDHVDVTKGSATGTFSIVSSYLNPLDPLGSATITVSFNTASTDPGLFSTFGFAPLAMRTDVRSNLGVFGTEFDFNLTAGVAPLPSSLSLLGIGFAGFGAARWRQARR